eukprot:3729590-Lingulodinium_polyedra.AAC.1
MQARPPSGSATRGRLMPRVVKDDDLRGRPSTPRRQIDYPRGTKPSRSFLALVDMDAPDADLE